MSLVLTPLFREMARKLGMVDMPDARRINKVPIPRGGGLSIFVAFHLMLGLLILTLKTPICQQFSFFWQGRFLLASGLLVTFGTTENFVRHIPEIEDERSPVRAHWADLGPALPILILIVAMAGARQFDQAMLPLLVQDIHGSIQGVSIWTGSLSAFCGIAGLLAAPLLGRLADRVPPPKIGKMSALGAGLLMLPQGLAHSFLLLFGCRFGMVFCAGGLDPVFQIWLSRVTPEHKRGVVFGWAATARSMGWVVAPLVSGVVASALGIRSVFFIGSLLFFGLVPLISVVVKRLARD